MEHSRLNLFKRLRLRYFKRYIFKNKRLSSIQYGFDHKNGYYHLRMIWNGQLFDISTYSLYSAWRTAYLNIKDNERLLKRQFSNRRNNA